MSRPKLLEAPTSGLRLWYATLAGIFWWLVHLMVLASTADLRCLHPGVTTIVNIVTVVTALLAAHATWWCIELVRANFPGDEESSEPPGRWLFLGYFGALTGAVSVLLILYEGSWVPFIDACS